jgi:radical SAM superfamily enzyme YgiQ (UPF0313 family)
MKVALINPNWNLHDINHTTTSVRPPKSIPLELIYIASSLSQESQIFDAYANNQSIDELIEEVENFKPDITVIETAPTYLFWRCPPLDLSVPSKTLKTIKQSINSKNIIIGPHGTIDPEWTREQTQGDIIVRGESDFSITSLIDSEYKGKTLDIRDNPVNLQKLPFPSFDMLDLSLYEPHAWIPEIEKHLVGEGTVNLALEFSRGCPFTCGYCLKDGFREKFRTKNASQMERELDFVANSGGSYVYFIDEIFNKPSKTLNTLLAQLKDRNIKFGNMSRPDIMTYEMIDKMAESGCIYIEYGLETSDPNISRIIGKNVNQKKVRDVIDYTKERIPIVNVFHLDFQSPDYVNILNLEANQNIEWQNRPIIPYPGTQIGEKLFEHYGINNNKWDFALRYIWWLQIEQLTGQNKNIKDTILFSNYEKAKFTAYDFLS